MYLTNLKKHDIIIKLSDERTVQKNFKSKKNWFWTSERKFAENFSKKFEKVLDKSETV